MRLPVKCGGRGFGQLARGTQAIYVAYEACECGVNADFAVGGNLSVGAVEQRQQAVLVGGVQRRPSMPGRIAGASASANRQHRERHRRHKPESAGRTPTATLGSSQFGRRLGWD